MQGRSRHRALIAAAANLFFPSSCPSCGCTTDTVRQAPFCSRCWHSLRKYAGGACGICGNPLASLHADVCSGCLTSPPAFSRVDYFGLYEGTLAEAIHRLKFQGIRRLHRPLTDLISHPPDTSIDVVVPVPLSASGLRARGFNQSLLIAHRYARQNGLHLIIDGLRKIKDTVPQIGLPARERAANVRGAYGATRSYAGISVLLVDDVVTTGATADECARVLRRAGARDVMVLALSRAGAP